MDQDEMLRARVVQLAGAVEQLAVALEWLLDNVGADGVQDHIRSAVTAAGNAAAQVRWAIESDEGSP